MLIRKLFRTAWKYKAQFISMIIMIAIGMGVFIGANMEWYSMEKNTITFMEDTTYADYRLYNEKGFTIDDIDKIQKIEGVDNASRILSLNVGVKDSSNSLSLFCNENYQVSTMLITSGTTYDDSLEGFWLSDKYANANNILLGDKLTITYKNLELEGEILGLVKSSEYLICVPDENQIMPDYSTYGFIYVPPTMLFNKLGYTYYSQINISSKLDKEVINDKINDALGQTTLVLSKKEHTSYAGVYEEIDQGKNMGAILPVLFLLIGVLTMITTMQRITTNEKTQIGTLKALGFKDKKILFHYTSYGLFVGVVGSILGIGLGFFIANILVGPNGMESTYLDLPTNYLYLPWFCILALFITIIFLTLISYLSVRKILKSTPAEALRPYSPKKLKPLKIEKTKIFNKFNFSTKWNLRDTFRHKTRTLMSLFGVVGCVILVMGAMGMKDTILNFVDNIDLINNYSTQINLSENATNEEIIELANDINGDYVSSSSVEYQGEATSLDIYHIANNKIQFLDRNNHLTTLSDDGVYICVRIADEGIKIGDEITFSPYGSEKIYRVQVAGIIRSVLNETITMTTTYADQIGISYHISSIYTDVEQNDIESSLLISGTQTKDNLMQSYNSFMSILQVSISILIIGAIILGVIVLYNLGIMSYVERYRELATLKVVGFKDKKISRILISQNIWLTLIGFIIGVPLGVLVLKLLVKYMASNYELKLCLNFTTYLFTLIFTVGLSLIVSFFISLKNKKINMVESLKGSE